MGQRNIYSTTAKELKNFIEKDSEIWNRSFLPQEDIDEIKWAFDIFGEDLE